MRRIEVPPAGIAAFDTLRGRRRSWWIALEPLADIPHVDLLGPEQSGKSLPLDTLHVIRQLSSATQIQVEDVGFRLAAGDELLGCCKWSDLPFSRQPQQNCFGGTRLDEAAVVCRHLGANPSRVDSVGSSVNDSISNAILGVRRMVRHAP